MNTHLNRKRCLVAARGGDYVHPGEEEAIDKVMSKFPKNTSRVMLDVGCGLGGTAQYIKNQEYGTPVCIDIEKDCIEYVNSNYPGLETHVSDVMNLKTLFPNKQFDLAYLFSSFYAFEDQQGSLKVIADLVKDNGYLVIFEYMTEAEYLGPNLFHADKSGFKPIRKDTIAQMLSNAGWKLEELVDMRADYIRWYTKLLANLAQKKDMLVNKLGLDTYDAISGNFKKLLEYFNTGQISGCTVYARKAL